MNVNKEKDSFNQNSTSKFVSKSNFEIEDLNFPF